MAASRWGLDAALAGRGPRDGLSLHAVPEASVVPAGALLRGRLEVTCHEGPYLLDTNEPALGVLLDDAGNIVGEYDGMLSGWGREAKLAAGEAVLLDFITAAVLPSAVDDARVVTPPGEYRLVVAVRERGDRYLWSEPVSIRVAAT